MSTVESIINSFKNRVTKILSLCDNLSSTCNDLTPHVRATQIKLNKLLASIETGTLQILMEYYDGNNDIAKCNSLVTRENYDMKITSIGSEIIDRTLHVCDNVKAKIRDALENICKQIEQHMYVPNQYINTIIYNVCTDCNVKMDLIEELSEYECPECGRCEDLVGAVFRNDQIYTQDGTKTRVTSNITQRHYRFWMDRIQGIESTEFDPIKIAAIEAVIARDKIYKQDLNCEIMRKILADPMVARTDWNDHATKLIKLVGGPEAPTLDYEEDRKISIKFDKAVQLYTQAAPSGAQYKSYYPDLIRRIIEIDFKDNKEKLALVKFIHIQQRKTTVKNDLIFKKICELAGPESGLVYMPTDPDRSKYM